MVHVDAVLDMEVGAVRTHTQVAVQKGVAAIQGVDVVGMVQLGAAKAGRVPCSVVGWGYGSSFLLVVAASDCTLELCDLACCTQGRWGNLSHPNVADVWAFWFPG